MTAHPVVSREEWLKARLEHLADEKEFTRQRDELSRRRLMLPWQRVEKDYRFSGPQGELGLGELFEGNSQLIVYHFMFAPGWKQGCDGCSFLADHFDGARLHITHHDVTLAAVSRAPFEEFQSFKQRMGWQFPWYSSFGSDFNFDYGVSFTEESLAQGPAYYNFERVENKKPGEAPGFSVFYRDSDGSIYHTYSTYARGGDLLIGAYNFLDMAPLGRNEQGVMDWMRLHDEYGENKQHAASQEE